MDKGSDEMTIHISTESIIKVILIGLLFFLVFVLRELILIVLTAVVIAAAVEPATQWFERHSVPRLPAVIIVYAGLGVFLSVAFYFLFLPVLSEASSFLRTLPQYLDSLSLEAIRTDTLSSADQVGAFSLLNGQQLSVSQIAGQINQTLANLSSAISGSFFSAVSVFFGGVVSFLLIAVLSFYLAVQERGITRFLHIATPHKYREYVIDLWQRSEEKIGLWMQGQLLLVLIMGLLTYIGLSFIDIGHALFLGFLGGLAELIPLFGPILAAIPALLIAFSGGGWTPALLVLGLYIVLQQLENNLIYPFVVNKVVGVPPIVVIISLVAGGTLAGFLGILLSVPLAAVLMEVLNDMKSKDHVEKEKVDSSHGSQAPDDFSSHNA